jgi:hypothetical protein
VTTVRVLAAALFLLCLPAGVPADPLAMVLPPATDVVLERADVQVELAPAIEGFCVAAQVRASYTFRCTRSPRNRPTTVGFGLPLRFPEASRHSVEDLAVTVVTKDGAAAAAVGECVVPLRDGNLQANERNGTCWDVRLAKGDTCRVEVGYAHHFWGRTKDEARYTYYLRPAGSWTGPVGVATVRVGISPALAWTILAPANLAPAARDEHGATWTLSRAEPVEDIQLELSWQKTQ